VVCEEVTDMFCSSAAESPDHRTLGGGGIDQPESYARTLPAIHHPLPRRQRMTLDHQNFSDVIGQTAYDTTGEKVGKIGQLYLDDRTGNPEFVTVNTGFFGTSETFVPASHVERQGDRVVLPYTKDQIKDAPNIDNDGHITEEQEQRLYAHYQLPYDTADYVGTGTGAPAAEFSSGTRTAGLDTDRDHEDTAMTRSEERLDVGTRSEEVGRARLRKYVTTEEETVTVPVTKERAVLVTEPITDENLDEATDGPDITEAEHEVTLHEEQVVVAKETVPVERVRLDTETVTEEETVSEEVRKEHIETEGDIDTDTSYPDPTGPHTTTTAR
jgi:uncharacterized protein (TIGR02271 family)